MLEQSTSRSEDIATTPFKISPDGTSVMSRYFELYRGSQTFYAIKNGHNIFVGGKKSGCVYITVTKSRGKLERLNFDSRCNTNGDMRRGAGTIGMVKAALAFAFEQSPEITEIRLEDHSHVDCKGTELYLPPFKIIENGLTWYESKLGARLEKVQGYMHIQEFCKHIREKHYWLPFWDSIANEFTAEIRDKKRKEIYRIWHKTSCFRDMILFMRDLGRCDLYVDWLYNYFSEHCKLNIVAQKYVILRPQQASPSDQRPSRETDSNPYIHALDERATVARQEGLDIFTNFLPRNSGTYYTHGRGPLTAKDLRDADIM